MGAGVRLDPVAVARERDGAVLGLDPQGHARAHVLEPTFAEARIDDEQASGRGRLRIVARLDCWSTLQRRELTLFANGTLRLRAGEPGREGMSLAELGPVELEEALARLGEVDLDETDAASTGPEGDWVDRCTLELALPDREPEVRQFKRFDSISLALARALDVLEGLAVGIEEPRPPAPGGGPPRLPVDYRPGYWVSLAD